MLWPQPHATAVIQPYPASRPLLLRYFEPLTTPDSLHPVLAYLPTRFPQQRRDPPIAIASVRARQLQDGSRQLIFLLALHHPVALRSSPLPQQPARTPLRQPMLLPGVLYRATSPFRAQKFPEATSCRT